MADEDYGALKVLVIEDEPASRALTVSILDELGVAETREAADGASALRALRSFSLHVILCDLVMEPMDGLAFVRAVRTDPSSPNPYVPVILVTASADRSAVRRARDAGVNLMLAKPIRPEALRKRLDLVLFEEREFIMNQSYVGPDRRRQDVPLAGRRDRRRP